jgi:hypothetical protein
MAIYALPRGVASIWAGAFAGEVALYLATLASYAAPSKSNLYARVWHRLAGRWQIDPSQDEGRLFGGGLATVFAACGGVVFLRRPGGGQEGRQWHAVL